MNMTAAIFATEPAAPASPTSPAYCISFFVPGLAAPGGSKTATVVRRKGGEIVTVNGRPLVTMRDAGKNNKEWRATVALFARQAYQGDPLSVPLDVRFEFVVQRPMSHYRGGDRERGVKLTAPRYPAKKPDGLKLSRSTEDACTGILWADDCQNVDGHWSKRYGEQPGCKVTVRVME